MPSSKSMKSPKQQSGTALPGNSGRTTSAAVKDAGMAGNGLSKAMRKRVKKAY
jgi:hypothetical protein